MSRFVITLAAALLLALPLRAQVAVEEVTTQGGIDAWLVEERSIPFVAIELHFLGGASLDPEGKEGAANLMASLMDQGAGEMDAQAFAEAVEGLGARMSFSASRDTISVSARFLSENRGEAADLLRTALLEPRFDADALERTRARSISSIRSSLRNPNAIASREFDARAYRGHPYSRPADGTEDSVAALTRDDLRDAHRRGFARGRVHVAAAGDISAEALAALLDDLLGDLPESGPELPQRAEVDIEGGVTVVPFDGPQSVIAFGHAGIPRDDDDFFAAYVMNEIMGGGRFGTRLMRELRERRGLTYGVGSYLVSQQFGDTYQGRMATSNAQAADAIELLRAEWRRMADEGVSNEELDAIKTYLTGAYPLRFDGNSAIARILAGMQLQGLDPDYMETRNDRIRAVTREDVRAVAERLLDPQGLHFVVVGRPEGLENGAD